MQMPTQLVHHTIDVGAQISVARIETDTHFAHAIVVKIQRRSLV